MLLGHRVGDGDKMLVFYPFNIDSVVIVRLFSLQSRQGDTAAADQCVTGAAYNIAAYGADVEFAALHIGRNVLVGDVLTIHQLDNGNPQCLRQRLQQ